MESMGELATVDAGSRPHAQTLKVPAIEIQVIRIQTAFTTREEFVANFRRFCTEDSCFIPTEAMRTVGLETGFSLRLADGTAMLRGLAVVLDAWQTDENPFRRPGIRLGLRKLTRDTRLVYDQLQEARLALGTGDYDASDAVPVAIGDSDDKTDRHLMDTIPMRAPVATLLGVAPIAVPRTETRDTIAMSPVEIAQLARGSAPSIDPADITDKVSVPPEFTQPVRVEKRSWWQRLVGRLRSWYRLRSMR